MQCGRPWYAPFVVKGLPKEAVMFADGDLSVTSSDMAGARYVPRSDARIVQRYRVDA